MICKKCGAEVPDTYKFCTKCGSNLEEQRASEAQKCPNCGAAIDPGAKFCTHCGAKLAAPEAAPAVTPVVAPEPESQTFYAQPQPAQTKTKTPAWVWLLIALLVVAIAFCVVWFFVLPKVNQTQEETTVSQTVQATGEAGIGEAEALYINANSEYASDAETQLGQLAADTIHQAKGWRNKSLMGECTPVDYIWSGNNLTVIVGVSIDTSNERDVVSTYYDYYYTYVTYKNVSLEDGSYHCEGDPVSPTGKKLNLYDSSGSRHMVAGYATEEEAREAALG